MTLDVYRGRKTTIQQQQQPWINMTYFFSNKKEFFLSKTIKEKIDLSYKMDLDHWDCLGRVKLVL